MGTGQQNAGPIDKKLLQVGTLLVTKLHEASIPYLERSTGNRMEIFAMHVNQQLTGPLARKPSK
jgi:hypothetical protein